MKRSTNINLKLLINLLNLKLNLLFLKAYNDKPWLKNVESSDKVESVNLYDMPLLEDDEKEVKEIKALKILTPNKLLKSLAANKMKNMTEQLLLKYKHGNDIHEHEKQQYE